MRSSSSHDFPLDRVSSVAWDSGMFHGTIKIHAAGGAVDIEHVNSLDGKALVDKARHALSQPRAGTATAPDHLAQLKQLGELRDAGIISAEEFEAKKVDILGRL